jgi:type II secretory pathway component GspD/PulD (secretin)
MEYVRQIKLIILLLITFSSQAFSLGELSKIVILEKSKNSATLELHIRERTQEEINDFNQHIKNEFIYTDPEHVGKGAVLVLDRITHGNINVREINKLPFINKLIIKKEEGGIKNKELIANADGRKYFSTKLMFQAKHGLNFYFLEREKKEAEPINYRIRISTVSENNKRSDLNPYLFKKYEKISAFDTRNPLANVVEQEHFAVKRKDLLNKIKEHDKTKYITAIHQLINIQASEALALVQAQLSPDGKIVQSRDTDILVITDQKPYVLNVLQILGQVDKQAPEVQIEVKIIELQEGAGKELGLNWRGKMQKNKRSGDVEFISSPTKNDLINGIKTPQNIVNGVIVNGLDSLSVSISALLKKGRARIMAEPKLLVANHQRGEFKMTKRHPILVRRSINLNDSTVTSNRNTSINDNQNTQNNTLLDQDTVYPVSLAQVGATNTVDKDEQKNTIISKINSNNTAETRNTKNRSENYAEVIFETGITLTVTPSIRKSGVIRLVLNPKITEMGKNELSDSPSLSVREINTVAYVGDGDTLLIGGLMYDKEETSESGVPILSKIPGLGRLFKSKKRSKSKTELIFLVKTKIVRL